MRVMNRAISIEPPALACSLHKLASLALDRCLRVCTTRAEVEQGISSSGRQEQQNKCKRSGAGRGAIVIIIIICSIATQQRLLLSSLMTRPVQRRCGARSRRLSHVRPALVWRREVLGLERLWPAWRWNHRQQADAHGRESLGCAGQMMSHLINRPHLPCCPAGALCNTNETMTPSHAVNHPQNLQKPKSHLLY